MLLWVAYVHCWLCLAAVLFGVDDDCCVLMFVLLHACAVIAVWYLLGVFGCVR